MNNRLKIGQEVLIRGYIDEIRKDTIIIRNDGGYFGTVQEEISVKQEPCEDVMAIHTQGLAEGIRCAMCTNSIKSDRGCDGGCIVDEDMYKNDVDTIRNLIVPPATPTQRKGKWEQYGDFWKEKYRCSECKEEQPKILCGEQIIGHWSDYCPNCGAKMEVKE